ncbi:MAG: A/G-specific adenine glycosylase [Solirubrobacterales bacterium]
MTACQIGMTKMPDDKRAGVRIVDWYRANRRDLPWRQTRDPYAIWISEIMLQQTQVDTVIPYWKRFLTRFPDLNTLAQADEADVLSVWRGLGYYSRGRNLHQAAKQLMDEHGGVFPSELAKIKALPGIGEYTAAAVASIAFEQPHAAVDGNVIRVIARLLAFRDITDTTAAKREITGVVAQMIPAGAAGDFTQGLMELGALLCTPKQPQCGLCPMKDDCQAALQGLQGVLPERRKKTPVLELQLVVAMIRKDDMILMEYRERETMLRRMWGLPLAEMETPQTGETALAAKYGLEFAVKSDSQKVVHSFTHRTWVMAVAEYAVKGELPPGLHWVRINALTDLAIPVAFQKALLAFDQGIN